jgi:hypothetical protein
MNSSTLFWRLVWKEYRMLRGFWIALALATVGLQLLVVVTITLTNGSTKDLAANMFVIGMAMVAFYALGCGAMLFAVEREEETYEFLRTLPVSGGQAMRAKFAVAAASVVALGAFVLVESALVSGLEFPEASQQGFLWGTFGLAAVEALAWGLFFSLLLRRPISAVFAAAGAGTVSVSLIVWWIEYEPNLVTGIEDFSEINVYRALVILAVVAADLWLARHWFDERLRITSDSVWGSRVHPERQTSGIALGSLLWQQWRQSRWTMIIMTALGLALVAWIMVIKPDEAKRAPTMAMATATVTLLFSVLAGASVFQADQSKQSFRFLAERGVAPATVWFTRHVVWIAPVAVWSLATVFLVLFAFESRDLCELAEKLIRGDLDTAIDAGQAIGILAGMFLVTLALVYSVGQFCSMFLRRNIVAAFVGLILAGVLCWWAGLMDTLGISWLWSVAPIPLVLLVATWLRTPHWLLERNDRRARLRAALSVIMPAVVLASAVIAFRVYQIPYAELGFSSAEFAKPISPEAKATADMYVKAASMIEGPPVEAGEIETPEAREARKVDLVKANGPAIALALEATAQPTCSFFDRGAPQFGMGVANLSSIAGVENLLITSARLLQKEGRLDEALDRYFAVLAFSRQMRPAETHANRLEAEVEDLLPQWATQTGQTEERIKRAVERLRTFYATLPPPTDWIKQDYAAATRLLELDPEYLASTNAMTPHELRMLRIGTALVPWEMARSRRMLKLVAALDIKAIEQVQTAMERGEPYADALESVFADSAQLNLGTTTLFFQFGMPLPATVANTVLTMQNRRRATVIVLALEAWKAKHGKLPRTLDELADAYLDKLPLDPYSGRPYRYVTWNSAGGGNFGITDGATYPEVPPGEVVDHYLFSEQPTVVPQALKPNGDPVLGPFGGTATGTSKWEPTSLEQWQRSRRFGIP